jgi:penicillin V acylase-like amidase (Ntn superfamily)
MAEEDMKTRGWRPNSLKILRADVNKYIESDQDVINLSLKIDYHLQLANYLEDIVKQINNRNFMIRAAIDWARFQAGGY